MFAFKKLRDRLYELRFDDQHEMCMTFLRYQEFYESPRFVGRSFTLAEFMSWYVKEQSKDGTFSYPKDWGGFNMPVNIIKQVNDLGIADPNHYDALMSAVYKMITAQCDNAYIIGVTYDAGIDKHELTHAMYHIDDKYHKLSNQIMTTNLGLIEELQVPLLNGGYASSTVIDEIQAYITTGDHRYFFKKFEKRKDFKELESALKELHKSHYASFLKTIIKQKLSDKKKR